MDQNQNPQHKTSVLPRIPSTPLLRMRTPPLELGPPRTPTTAQIAPISSIGGRVRPVSRIRDWRSAPMAALSGGVGQQSELESPHGTRTIVMRVAENGTISMGDVQALGEDFTGKKQVSKFRATGTLIMVFLADFFSDARTDAFLSFNVALALCGFVESDQSIIKSSRSVLVMGISSPVFGVYLSHCVNHDGKLYLADIPGFCPSLSTNAKLHSLDYGEHTSLCEMPWDEDDFTGAKKADIVFIDTSCFFYGKLSSTDQGVEELAGYITRFVEAGSKVYAGIHRAQISLWERVLRNLNSQSAAQLTISDASQALKHVHIATIYKRKLPRINSHHSMK